MITATESKETRSSIIKMTYCIAKLFGSKKMGIRNCKKVTRKKFGELKSICNLPYFSTPIDGYVSNYMHA